MNGEKAQRRSRRLPIRVEEKLTINSTSTTTEIHRQWYENKDDKDGNDDDLDDDDDDDIPFHTLAPDETIAEKIERLLKRINAWTNETTTNNQKPIDEQTTFTKTSKSSCNYENFQQDKSNSIRKEVYRNRYRSSSSSGRAGRTRHSSFRTNSVISNDRISTPISFPDPHEYDNLKYPPTATINHEFNPIPFPTIVVDCQRCSQTVDRSSLRDMSCQVPSDDDLYHDDIQSKYRQASRSTSVYHSPRSSFVWKRQRQVDDSLSTLRDSCRRNKTVDPANYLPHHRSKSVPSASSFRISTQTVEPSANTLIRSIKTSIHAMKKRLKDFRRFSEVCRSFR